LTISPSSKILQNSPNSWPPQAGLTISPECTRTYKHIISELRRQKNSAPAHISRASQNAHLNPRQYIQKTIIVQTLITSQRLWSLRLFTFRTTNCVYRFISYQQNRKPIRLCCAEQELTIAFARQ
jgi:hypothetical protein